MNSTTFHFHARPSALLLAGTLLAVGCGDGEPQTIIVDLSSSDSGTEGDESGLEGGSADDSDSQGDGGSVADGGGECIPGTENCECVDGLCFDGLSCEENVCVPAGAGSGDTGESGAGDTGADDGGDSGTGGEQGACADADPGWNQGYGEDLPVPHWEGIDAQGEAFRLCEFDDKPVMFKFFATWCGPCNNVANEWANDQQGTPYSKFINAANEGRAHLISVMVDPGNDQNALSQWDSQYPTAALHLLPNLGTDGNELSSAAGIGGFPSFRFICNDFLWCTESEAWGEINP